MTGSRTIFDVSELRSAVSRLGRSRTFAILSVGTLAVGLGINAAMFGVLDALLLRAPFHVQDPDRVVAVQFRAEGEIVPLERTQYPTFIALQDSHAFESVAAHMYAAVSIGTGPDARIANAMLASTELFDVLRLVPKRGSLKLSDGDGRGDPTAAVISHSYWIRHFAGAETVLGATLVVDRRLYTIVGIAPEGFQGPGARPVELWLPLDHVSTGGIGPRNWRENTGPFWLYLIARLPNASQQPSSAEARATAAITGRPELTRSGRPPLTVTTASIVPGRGSNRSIEARVAIWLGGLSALVLLIACANVSNLILARSFLERRHYRVLSAIGATTLDLIKRVVADIFILVAFATAAGLLLSFMLRNAIPSMLVANIPLSRELLEPRTGAILAGCSVVAFLFLLSIALSQLRVATSAIRTFTREHSPTATSTARWALLSLQAGISLFLLFLAGLFASSLSRAEALDLGVDVDRTLQLTLNVVGAQRSPADIQATYERTRNALSRHPGIERVAFAEASPYSSGAGASPWTEERSASELWSGRDEVAYRSVVGAGFFTTVGADSLRGRDFVEADGVGGERVAIVNRPLAMHLWRNEDPLGQCMWLDGSPTCLRIVGVLDGVWKFSALSRDKMAVYLPLTQVPDATPGALFLRTRGDSRAVLGQVVGLAQRLNPDLPAARGALLRDAVDQEFRAWRLGAAVFSAFGLVALVIATVGIYGVISLGVALRTKELGIRISLGASRGKVIATVVREGLSAVVVGLVIGSAGANLAGTQLGGVVFETSPRDPLILFGTGLLLLIVATIALVPLTWRALATDPAVVLRAD